MHRRGKILVGLASLTLFDIAVANAAPVSNWTGLYVGAQAGYRWAYPTLTSAPYSFDFGEGSENIPGRNDRYDLFGVILGVHAGYNYLISPQWLVGIEGDIDYGRDKSSQSAGLCLGTNCDSFLFRQASMTLSWQATLRARLGYVVGPWMFYGTGGVAFIRVKWTENASFDSNTAPDASATYSTTKILTGSVAGAGMEYMFDPRWTGRIEYLFEHFGGFDVSNGFGPQTGRVEVGDVQKLRFGLSYKLMP